MTTNNVASVESYLNIKKLKETKATAGKFVYFDDPGEYLVRIESSMFGNKTKVSGGLGAPFFALENLILASTSNQPHLRVGRTANMYAEDEGKQAQVYLPKIKNAIEAILDMTQKEIEDMTDADFAKVVQELFFDKLDAKGNVVQPAQAVGEILSIKAVASKNKAKEDRVYSTYHVATDDQLAAAGYARNEKNVIVKVQ